MCITKYQIINVMGYFGRNLYNTVFKNIKHKNPVPCIKYKYI